MDIFNIILSYIKFNNQIKLVQCDIITNISITDLYYIDNIYKMVLNDNIIKNYKNIKYIEVNNKITNVNHCVNLEKLDAYGNCGINDNGIKDCINIKELDVSNNNKITNVNHCVNLEKLYAYDNCGINDYGIKDCINIKELHVYGNNKITRKI